MPVKRVEMACVSEAAINEIRRSPTAVRELRARCDGELGRALGPAFQGLPPSQARALVLAAAVAYRMAPYGTSREMELEALVKDDRLDCDNYMALAWHLARLLGVKEQQMRFIGWHGGAVGNHAQLFVEFGDGQNDGMVLDPTVGLVGRTTFNAVAAGVPVRGDKLLDFRSRAELPEYHQRVQRALAGGEYRPDDVLYAFERFDRFSDPPAISDWPTPAAPQLRRDLEAGRAS